MYISANNLFALDLCVLCIKMQSERCVFFVWWEFVVCVLVFLGLLLILVRAGIVGPAKIKVFCSSTPSPNRVEWSGSSLSGFGANAPRCRHRCCVLCVVFLLSIYTRNSCLVGFRSAFAVFVLMLMFRVSARRLFRTLQVSSRDIFRWSRSWPQSTIGVLMLVASIMAKKRTIEEHKRWRVQLIISNGFRLLCVGLWASFFAARQSYCKVGDLCVRVMLVWSKACLRRNVVLCFFGDANTYIYCLRRLIDYHRCLHIPVCAATTTREWERMRCALRTRLARHSSRCAVRPVANKTREFKDLWPCLHNHIKCVNNVCFGIMVCEIQSLWELCGWFSFDIAAGWLCLALSYACHL